MAHHEAGHAVAFLEIGHQIREMYLDPYEGFTNPVDPKAHADPRFTFVLYAGPWAHARAKTSANGVPAFEDVSTEMRANFSDWRAYEELMPGGDVGKVDRVDIATTDAYFDASKSASNIDYPPIAPPLRSWDDDLAALAPKIEQLVEELQTAESAGVVERGFLGGELPLVKVSRLRWQRPEGAR